MSAFDINQCKHLTVSALLDSTFPAIESTGNQPMPMITSKTVGYIHTLMMPHHRHRHRPCAQFQSLGDRTANPLPARSRTQVRADRRRHLPRHHGARPIMGGAPNARPRRLSRADQGVVHVRIGHASRRRRDRRTGAQCGARDFAGSELGGAAVRVGGRLPRHPGLVPGSTVPHVLKP